MRRLVPLLVPLVLLGSACADPSDTGAPRDGSPFVSPEGAFPVTVTAANGDVTLEERPEAIVSLSPTATEMLFAIGAGDQVEAVDDQSDYPAGVPTTDLKAFEPNAEAISEFEPDLVVVSDDIADVVASMEALGVPALVLPAVADVDGAYEQLEILGDATGHPTEAAEVVEGMRSDIDAIVEGIPAGAEPLSYYHELDPTFFSVTSDTFIGQVYALVGLENIADAADGASSGYPQLSAEYIIEADPDLIFLADSECCGQDAQTVSERAGWDQITAVENGAVVGVGDDVASRWGPRIVDLLEVVAEAVAGVRAAA